MNEVKLVVFDLDGTLIQLSINYDVIQNNLKQFFNTSKNLKPLIPTIIELSKNDQNKIINFESSASIFSHEIDALSKCILEDKLKPNFPDLTINDIIGNMKIIDKWKN